MHLKLKRKSLLLKMHQPLKRKSLLLKMHQPSLQMKILQHQLTMYLHLARKISLRRDSMTLTRRKRIKKLRNEF
jgi:hypothetical protein